MGYWKSKVAPRIKKLIPFELGSTKKKAAAEALKPFEESKEAINKEFEEKKEELTPKVVEAYEAASPEVKTVVKERKDSGLKKNNASAVNKFLEELAKLEFPGAKQASELSTKFGPALVSPAVFSVFEKVASVLPPEPEPEPAAETKEKEVVVEEVKKEEESSGSAVPPAEEAKAPVAEEPKKPESESEPPKTEEPPKEAAAEAPKPEEAPKKD